VHPSGAFSAHELIKESAFDCEPLAHGHVKGLSVTAVKLIHSMLCKDRDQGHNYSYARIRRNAWFDFGPRFP
jgi:hypothetical protein